MEPTIVKIIVPAPRVIKVLLAKSIAVNGLPTGGTINQVLRKKSGTNYDTEWADPEGGGVSTVNNVSPDISGNVNLVPANIGAEVAGAAAAAENAAKSYADALVVGLWDDRGNYNASTNLYPAAAGSGPAGAILKGDIWTVSVAGVLGGTAVSVGDTVRALIDVPGQTAANWAIAENNIGYVPENQSNKKSVLNLSTDEFPNSLAVLQAFFNIALRWSGRRYTFPYIGSVTTNAGWGESLIYIPIPVLFPHFVTHITCRVTIAVAGANIRLGLATVDATGYPTTLLDGSGLISAATIGDKEYQFLTPIALTGKVIYGVIATSSNSIGLLGAGSNVINLLERPAGTNATPAQYRIATPFAPLPANFPAGQVPVNSYGIILELTMQ